MKENILFILPGLPYPLKSGGHQAMYNSITAIRNDYNVFLAYDTWAEENSGNYEEEFSALFPEICLLPYRQNAGSSLRDIIVSGISKTAKAIYGKIKKKRKEFELCQKWINDLWPRSDDWLSFIDRICTQNHFDIIQVEMPWMISQVLTLPKGPKKVFVHHELGFVRRELEQNSVGGLQYYVKAYKSIADIVEVGLLNMYDSVITLSSDDANKLIDKGVTIPVYPSFAVVDTKEFSPVFGDGTTLSFVGPDSHSPNLIGVLWFLENCWANLKNMNPNYNLQIIGRWGDENKKAITEKYQDVRFLGFVDNLSANLKGTVMIVPITIGSGIRMKILEACSIGVPFVSTTVGAEGLHVIDGEHCFIADKPNDFVEKIVQLQEIDIQKKFVDNSNALVKMYFSKDALRDNRLSIYHDLNK